MARRARRSVPKRAAPRAQPKAHRSAMMMLMVEGDPTEALQGVALPAGAKVAIVSPDAEAVERIKHSGRLRFGTIRRVVADAKSPAQEPRKPLATLLDREAFEPDARARALLEGVRIAHEDLRAAGGAYDLEQVRTLLRGISRQAVDKRVQEGSLLAVPGPSNRRSFPTLQFNRDGTIVDGLKAVQEALPTRNPWTVLNFLIQSDDRLNGRRPIDALKEGKVNLAVEAARRMGEQGA